MYMALHKIDIFPIYKVQMLPFETFFPDLERLKKADF